jgi:hypothetical protein
MNRTSIPFALSLFVFAACSSDAPTVPRVLASAPLFAKQPAQTLYAFAWQGGLQSDVNHPFSALAKTGDPFGGSGIDADGVYLVLPTSSGGVPSVCDAGSTLDPSTGAWVTTVGDYSGLWVGHVVANVSPGKQGITTANFSFNAKRSDGTGWIWLVLKGGGVTSSNGKLTLSFTNSRGLMSAYSTPTGSFDPRVGPFDPQDRCLTFSITATP